MIALIRDSGTRIIMVTHDMGQAKRLADDIVFLHHGKVMESGPARGFFHQPSTPEATAYLEGELLW
jgi:tungstate transport system ATP-binding protein